MKHILITGGAGFIGSNLAKKLKSRGYSITVLDNLSSQVHGDFPEQSSPTFRLLMDTGVRFIEGSVTDKDKLMEAIEGQDAIIHLAAETGTGQSMYEIDRYVNTNIRGTAMLLDIIANSEHSVKKIVVASSRAIYGEGKYQCADHGVVYPEARELADLKNSIFECRCPQCHGPLELLPTDEGSKIHPTSIYGITKQSQEEMIMTIGKSLKIPAVGLRYQNVYGPGQSLGNPYTGILSIFSTRIKNGNDINIFEDGKESRDFVYIDDVVDATILSLEKPEANYQVFNVGANECIDVLKVATLLKENYESGVNLHISGNFRVGDIRHNYADLTKISDMLGYYPKVSFEEGISNFCRWVEMQEVYQDNYHGSIELMRSKGLYN